MKREAKREETKVRGAEERVSWVRPRPWDGWIDPEGVKCNTSLNRKRRSSSD